MINLYSQLVIKGYEEFDSLFSFASYTLQLNPKEIKRGFTEEKSGGEKVRDARGRPIKKDYTYFSETLSFNFTIDNAGTILFGPPDGNFLPLFSVEKSIKKLKKVAITPRNSTHEPPFVKLVWSTNEFFGKISSFEINYTHFNYFGSPLRAEISLTVTEKIDPKNLSKKFQSPDITRMPIILDGKSLPNLCNEYYKDSRYCIDVAKKNKLTTFRRVNVGERLSFPPIEK